ncbi:MAG: hypothetical protein AB1791_00105 [Chloroflexota bacterium]
MLTFNKILAKCLYLYSLLTRHRWFFIFLLQVGVALSSMAAVPHQSYCDLYNDVITWIRTGAGIITVLAILYLGGQKLASSIIPDLGFRTGTVVVAITVGLVLVAFGEDIAASIIESFGLPAVAC